MKYENIFIKLLVSVRGVCVFVCYDGGASSVSCATRRRVSSRSAFLLYVLSKVLLLNILVVVMMKLYLYFLVLVKWCRYVILVWVTSSMKKTRTVGLG